MRISQLKYLISIAENGSMSLASEKLNIAQPSLSRAIKELEDEMGTKLFERKNRGMQPTEKGQEIINAAAAIVDEYDKLIRKYCDDCPK